MPIKNNNHGISLKKVLAYIGILIVLVLTTISFIFLPAIGPKTGDTYSSVIFGKWGKNTVRFTDDSFFAAYIKTSMDQLERSGMGNIDETQRRELWEGAYYQSILRLAAKDYLTEAGYFIPDSIINKMIVDSPVYKNPETQTFSKEAYNAASESFKKLVRDDITDSTLYQEYIFDMLNIPVTKSQYQLFGEMAKTKKNFIIGQYSMTTVPDEIYENYGNENSEKFSKYDISIISTDSSSAAENLKTRIAGNELTFEDAAMEFSTKTYSSDNGQVSNNFRYQIERFMSEEDLEKIDALSPGEISGVIKLGNLYGFVKVNGLKKAYDSSDNTMFEAVKNYVNSYEKSLVEDYFIAEAENLVAGLGSSQAFRNACNREGLNPVETGFIPLNYGNTTVISSVTEPEGLSGIMYNEVFLKEAFALNDNEIGNPFVFRDKVLVISCAETIQDGDDETVNKNYREGIAAASDSTLAYGILLNKKHENLFSQAYQKFFN